MYVYTYVPILENTEKIYALNVEAYTCIFFCSLATVQVYVHVCIIMHIFIPGLRTNVRRAYAEFQPSFIDDHGKHIV